MAAVREAKYPLAEFQRNIHMNSFLLIVRALQQLSSIREPHQLAIEPEMQGKQSAIEYQKHIFAFAVHPPD